MVVDGRDDPCMTKHSTPILADANLCASDADDSHRYGENEMIIGAVVTSKLDLGETAAQLPEEPDEPEQFEEVESQAFADHDLDDVDLDGAFGQAEV